MNEQFKDLRAKARSLAIHKHRSRTPYVTATARHEDHRMHAARLVFRCFGAGFFTWLCLWDTMLDFLLSALHPCSCHYPVRDTSPSADLSSRPPEDFKSAPRALPTLRWVLICGYVAGPSSAPALPSLCLSPFPLLILVPITKVQSQNTHLKLKTQSDLSILVL